MTVRDIIEPGARLADGQWHRLHPATPVLKGGIALLAIVGVIIVNIRDILIDVVIGGGDVPSDRDPLVWIYEHEFAGLFALALLAGVLLFVGGFYLSWRMHRFRVTDEQVEVQSGILFRTNRRGRLDRIQGINISKPFLARLFGAAKLEVSVAGQNANVQLAYLGSAAADELRREILLRASGTHSAAADAAPSAGGVIGQRVSELLSPELDPDAAPPESVVQMHLGRLIGSLLLSGFTVVLIGGIVALVVVTTTTRQPFFLFGFVPAIIGMGGFYISRFTRSLRYSIASTPDGIRVGFGLLSTSNETLPPGRIHAVKVSQPLLWRPAGWWEVKINRASSSSASGAAGQANTTILPVGNLSDTMKVLELVLPGLVDPAAIEMLERGMLSKGGDDGFTNSPRRARILRWFSWNRNGFAVVPGAVMFRSGAIWRELVVVPQARLQSLGMRQGPLLRRLRLATLSVHTVAGPVVARLGAIDKSEAVDAFGAISAAAVSSAEIDTSHRWRMTLPPAPPQIPVAEQP
ncbi:PH domain-containing protein [Salinibacterium sp. G-O1]|uniref:PH domain-containing protein n=1 Tax=Salinibacterium sp. G-O1 TaxID=3046208 RepID=UPI0024B92AD0|nr:PH domain-containing protein [Salinibacterium sp. G-O1]MDJ0333906.1 PH domain-containing protein [Salinibacterium sp. G-O1]